MNNGRKDGRTARHRHHLYAGLRLKGRVLVRKDIQLPAPGPNLLQIGLELLKQLIVGGHGHHGHVLIHQRQGAMLKFPRGIPFGMDIADFFEL